MKIDTASEGIWIVHLEDDPDMSEALADLKLEATEADRCPTLILDLADVTRISSSDLSQFLRLRKLTLESSCRLVLVGVCDAIWAVFTTTGLDAMFNFAQDIDAARAEVCRPQSRPQ